MKKIKVLYSSADVHAGIKWLFSKPSARDRRVALVAYVGGDGESYLPHPDGLRIICSPSAGGTDPDTLRSLIKRNAKVEFSDGLHMKIYWSRNRGCIITSANASSSALGCNGLKESGILLPPGLVEIDRLIKYANPRSVEPSELRKLDKQAREREKNLGVKEKRQKKIPDFLNWYAAPHRSTWKIAWTDNIVSGTAKEAKEQTFSEYGRREPYTWVSVGKERVSPNDWLLSFTFTERGVKSIEWKYIDFVVKISPKEKRYYERDWPCHAVQVHGPSRYPIPPFKITPQFRKTFNNAIKRYSCDRITKAKTDVPPVHLLNYIAEEMKTS